MADGPYTTPKKKPTKPKPSTLNIGTTAVPPVAETATAPYVPPHAGSTWFDMFAQAPTLGAAPPAPAIPRVGGGAAPAVDPLNAFLLGQRQQQLPMIPQFDPAELVKALRYDPVGEHSRLASLPSYAPESQSPFATGYFNQPQLTPEAQLASQGGTARNQWAQLGGVQGIDPELLRRLNASRLR